MKRLSALLIFFASPAFAQTAPDTINLLLEDWNAYEVGRRHVTSSIQALITELLKARTDNGALTKERDELKAERELKAGAEKKP